MLSDRFDALEAEVSRLLCRFFEPRDTHGFNSFDYVHAFGSPVLALMYSRIFWPHFVELDGMVFLGSSVEDEEDAARVMAVFRSCGGDRTKTEVAFNLVEVPALFGSKSGETTDVEDLWLAEMLAEMWRWRLKARFPGTPFNVKVVRPEESGAEIAVLFHQVRG